MIFRQVLTIVGVVLAASVARAETVLYKAARVHTMTGPAIESGEVLVRDGVIVAVGTDLDIPDDTAVVDLGEAELMPGCVNPYTQHGVAGGNDEYTREVTPNFEVGDVLDLRDQGLRIAAGNGVTTASIAPGTENVIAGVSAVVKTGGARLGRALEPQGGLVISLCSDPQNRNNSRQRPDSIYVRQPTNRMGTIWILRSTFDAVRRTAEGAGSQRIARALGGELPLFCVSRTMYDLGALITIAEEFGCRATAVGCQEAWKIAPRLAAANIDVVLAPLTGATTGPENTELNWNQASVLAAAGIRFSFSGDRMLEQARFAHRFGLNRDAALAAVTRTPAELLGVGDRVGSIAPGYDADLIATDGDPLEFTTPLRWVMIDGALIGQPERQNRVLQGL